MTDAAHNPDDYCYRHPDRLSFVLCERCGRTICLECQNHVGGKVLCPDDAKTVRSNVTPITSAKRVRRNPIIVVPWETPIVSYVLMGLLALIFLADLVVGGGTIERQFIYVTGDVPTRAWTLVTSMLGEIPGGDGILGLFFNGFVIYILGKRFESEFGHLKFLLLYVGSALGASAFAFLFNGWIVGAGSAVFGLLGAAVILLRRQGGSLLWIYISIGVSLLAALLSSARAFIWQGDIGGLLLGGLIAFTYLYEGSPARVQRQRVVFVAIAVALVAAALLKAILAK